MAREGLEGSLKVDRDALDQDLIRQPQLWHDAAEAFVAAVAARDTAKMDLDLLRAKLDQEVRSAADVAKEKITEAGVKARVEGSEEWVVAERNHLRLCERADSAYVLREAFSQRAFVLRDLVSLYAAGYWSESSVRAGDAGKRLDDFHKDRRKALAAKRREKAGRGSEE